MLQGMTGFARVAVDRNGLSLVWEVKSVNSKSIEVRTRLPAGLDRLETAMRQAVQARFARGSFQLTLSLTRAGGVGVQPTVNEAFLKDLAGLAKRLELQFGMAPARADGLLALRGVLEAPESVYPAQNELAAEDAFVLPLLDDALAALETARQAEGSALAALLAGHIDLIEVLTARAEADPSRQPGIIRERIAAQISLLVGAASGLDEGRLHQEAALLAIRADLREELDRLKIHVASARALLAGGGPMGRKLEFLAQEFGREANTLCSKSNGATLTATGLELKAVVDQFREQVQNLE